MLGRLWTISLDGVFMCRYCSTPRPKVYGDKVYEFVTEKLLNEREKRQLKFVVPNVQC